MQPGFVAAAGAAPQCIGPIGEPRFIAVVDTAPAALATRTADIRMGIGTAGMPTVPHQSCTAATHAATATPSTGTATALQRTVTAMPTPAMATVTPATDIPAIATATVPTVTVGMDTVVDMGTRSAMAVTAIS